MQTNDIVKVAGKEYRIEGSLGAGGQGAIYLVTCLQDNAKYALKKLQDKDAKRLKNKVENIKDHVNKTLDGYFSRISAPFGINHVIPNSFQVDMKNSDTCYIMERVGGKSLSDMLADGTIRAMSMEAKLKLAYRIAKAIDILHSDGYCYTDISWSNFMWDEQNDVLNVIDCENMTSSAGIREGKCFLVGTGFFIAPEVAFGQATVGYATDRYALAVLIFRLLLDNVLQSPYHGEVMCAASPACMNMVDVAEWENEGFLERGWRYYVFDPDHRENGIDNLCKNSKNQANREFRQELDRITKTWESVDPRLKALFLQCFADPFATQKRPTVSVWVKVLKDVLENPQGHAGVPVPSLPALRKKATLTSSNGDHICFGEDEHVLLASELGMAGNKIGVLRKTEGGYTFESAMLCVVDILGADNKKRTSLGKGKTAVLSSGDKICPGNCRIMITLTY